MKKTKNFNNIPKEMEASLKKRLKGKSSVRFKLANIIYENGEARVSSVMAIPTEDRIYDPVTDQHYSIALIREVDRKGNELFQNFNFFAREKGIKNLRISSAIEREQLEFLLLSDHNGSKEGRDVTKKIYYYEFDPEKIADKQVSEKIAVNKVISIISSMTNEQVIAFAGSKGWDTKTAVNILRNSMFNEAEKDRVGFMKLIDPSTIRVSLALHRGDDQGVIHFNTADNAWIWKGSGDVIKDFPRSKKFDRYAAFAKWMEEDDKAHEVLESIEKMVGIKPPKKK